MAIQTLSRRRTPARRKKKSRTSWYAWWPSLLGIASTPFAMKTAEILPLMGNAGLHRLCLLFPFAMLAQQHSLGLGEAVSQASMYLQFPVYGILSMLVRRFRSLAAGFLAVAVLHTAAAATAWLLVIKR